MMMTAVRTPIHCVSDGVPSSANVEMTDVDENYVVAKSYYCSAGQGHEFMVVFESPWGMPVLWECPDHEIIAFEN